MRLDRFLTRHTPHTRNEVKHLLSSKRVAVSGEIEQDSHREISEFTEVALDGETLQKREAVYLMLHKPDGYLSATSDPQHPTVIDLIDHPNRSELHLAGRLDRASTGLLLLTNDGKWSRMVTEPDGEIAKTYRVTTRDPILEETASIFGQGIYFAYEDLTTRPAQLEILGSHEALISIHEGRYHQVKRMFHAVGNKVLSLHRESIGPLVLDPDLAPGQCRSLTAPEIAHFRGRL
ncbi:MAG: pseudouridine synthase [Luteolibacter sp.]